MLGSFAGFLGSIKSTPQRSIIQEAAGAPLKFSQVPELPLDHTADGAVFCRVPAKSFLPKGSGYGSVLQANRNKIQHSLHGNTTLYLTQLLPLATPSVTLNLSELLPVPQCTTDPQKYSRSLLLAARPITKLGQALISLAPRTKPPLQGTAQQSPSPSRTGRRRKPRDPLGQFHFYKKPKNHKKRARVRRIKGIHPELEKPRSPPPRGTPGAPSGASEECPQPQEGSNAHPRGAKLRRSCRRAYRTIGDGAGNATNKGIRGRTRLLPPLLRPQKPPPPARIGFVTQSTGKKS